MTDDGTSEFVIVPVPGSCLSLSEPVEAVIVRVPRLVEEMWTLFREYTGESRREVFYRCGRVIRRGPVGEVVTRTRYGVHRPVREDR